MIRKIEDLSIGDKVKITSTYAGSDCSYSRKKYINLIGTIETFDLGDGFLKLRFYDNSYDWFPFYCVEKEGDKTIDRNQLYIGKQYRVVVENIFINGYRYRENSDYSEYAMISTDITYMNDYVPAKSIVEITDIIIHDDERNDIIVICKNKDGMNVVLPYTCLEPYIPSYKSKELIY